MKRLHWITSIICLLLTIGVHAQAFSPNGKYFVEKTVTDIKVWNLETGEALYSYDISGPKVVDDLDQSVNMSGDYKVELVSHTGRFVILNGYEDFNLYGKVRKGIARVTVDLKEKKVVDAYIQESRYKRREIYLSMPNSDQYVMCQSKINKEEVFMDISLCSFSDNTIETLRIKGDPKVKGYDSKIGIGTLIERDDKLYYAAIYTLGTKLYDLSNLEACKPLKLRFKKEDYYPCTNANLSIYFDSDDKEWIQNGKQLSTADQFKYTSFQSMGFIEGTSLISLWDNRYNDYQVFDYQNNKYVVDKKLFTGDYEWSRTSPNGKFFVVKFTTGKKVYNLITGELITDLAGNDERIIAANDFYKKGEYDQAIYMLNQVSESGKSREDYNLISFYTHGALANYTEACAHLEELNYSIPLIDYYNAAVYLSGDENHQKALELLWEYQKYDVRVGYERLEKDFPFMDGIESFELLVSATKALDTYAEEFTSEKIIEFEKRKVGLYDLRIKEAYRYLNGYKESGLEDAFSDAAYSLQLAREHYALTANGKGMTFAILGKSYMKTDDLVLSYKHYKRAISIDTTVGFFYVECAVVCQRIKRIIEEELVQYKKEIFWPAELRDDYKAMDDRTRELADAYIAQFPEDPMGYYVRAMSSTSLRGDYHENRMKYAQKALNLFKEQGLEAPEHCAQMADRYFGLQTVQQATAPEGCSDRCGKCGGHGAQSTSESCGVCSGTGKTGSCYGCNGRGRKYDTTRNQQVCYTCSGSGRLSCYSCNATGRKSTRRSCTQCSGSGYDCD